MCERQRPNTIQIHWILKKSKANNNPSYRFAAINKKDLGAFHKLAEWYSEKVQINLASLAFSTFKRGYCSSSGSCLFERWVDIKSEYHKSKASKNQPFIEARPGWYGFPVFGISCARSIWGSSIWHPTSSACSHQRSETLANYSKAQV